MNVSLMRSKHLTRICSALDHYIVQSMVPSLEETKLLLKNHQKNQGQGLGNGRHDVPHS